MQNQYGNLTPQLKMAQMFQQKAQPTQLQGDMQQQMPQAQNPFSGVQDAMKMYQQASQQSKMQEMQDYMARMKLGQAQTSGMFDRGNAVGPDVTANNYTG